MTLLNLKDIQLKFAGTDKPALQHINFSMMKGDFVIVLGSNGSGKSSLLKLLHRHYKASAGNIYFLDQAIASYSPKLFSQQIAVLTQDCADSLFTELSIYENFQLIKKFKNISIDKKSERDFLRHYLQEYNANLANKLDASVNNLSGGEKQALALALCLLQPPALLLLDEHTSALDPKTSEQIMQLTARKIKEQQISCLLTTHDLNIALNYGNRILSLREGSIHQIIDEEQKAVMTKEALMGIYF